MRRLGIALLLTVALSGCVQTRQYADVEFSPPQGDYKLLVMRPDVTVGSVTTGGLVEPRADWTETARAKLLTALRAQQAANRLSAAGLASVEPMRRADGMTLYRVVMPAPADEAAAYALRDRVAEIGFTEARIVRTF